MSQHALDRLAERFPHLDPHDTLSEIRAAISRGYGFKHQGASDVGIREIWLESGDVAFAVTTPDGLAIKTVLSVGMECPGPTGPMVLERSCLGPGVHQGVPDHVYHADPCETPSLSSGMARTLVTKTPLHGWVSSRLLNPEWEPVIKKEFDFGHAAHGLILGRGKEMTVIPEDLLGKGGSISTKAAKEFVAEVREAGGVALKQEAVDRVHKMRDVMLEAAGRMNVYFDPAQSEVVAVARVEGVLCRTMIDNVPLNTIEPLRDIKTTTDCSTRAIEKKIMDLGYDMQAAHYVDTWFAATGEQRGFQFWFQEKEAPFAVRVIELHPDDIQVGRMRLERARKIWDRCLASGYWPSYPVGVTMLRLPAYYTERWLEQASVTEEYQRQHGRDILDHARRWQAPEGAA